MHTINKSDERKILIDAEYSEAHLISEALSMYRLRMETIHGRNSEEEMMIGELRYMIMNPVVKESTMD